MLLIDVLLLTPLVTTILATACLCGVGRCFRKGRPVPKAAFVATLGLLSVALAGTMRVWASDPSPLVLLPARSASRRTWPLRIRKPLSLWKDARVSSKTYGVLYFAILSTMALFKVLRSISRRATLRRMHNCVATILATVGLPCVACRFLCSSLGAPSVPAPLFVVSVATPFGSAVSGVADRLISAATCGLANNGLVPPALLAVTAALAALQCNGAGALGCAGVLAHLCFCSGMRGRAAAAAAAGGGRDATLPLAVSAVANYFLMLSMLDPVDQCLDDGVGHQ